VQHRYLQWIGSRRSGLHWLTALIQKLWDIAWDTWDHRNRVLHDTELSVARDLEIQQITEQFQLGRADLPNEVKASSEEDVRIYSNNSRPTRPPG
jgi:hypothetical protein